MIYYGKNHWYSIIINFFEIVKKLWTVILIVLIPTFIGGFIGAIIVFSGIAIFCFFKWLYEYIIIDEEYLLYRRGIFKSEKVKIPLSSISLVEFNRNIIHVILGLRRVKIETISPKDRRFDVSMVLKKNKIMEFQKVVTYHEDHKKNENYDLDSQISYKVSARHIAILATLRSNIVLGIGIIYSLIHLLISVDERIKIDIKSFVIGIVNKDLFETAGILGLIIYFIIAILFVVTIVMFFSVFGIMSKYYKFKIARKNNYVYIDHGLIVRRNYSIRVENIHAIKIEQNLINQILNLYTIKGSIVGYGNDSNEEEVIFPLCDEIFMKNIIRDIVPEFNFKGEIQTPPKRAFNNFYISWTIWAVLFAIVFLIFTKGDFLGFITIPIMILWRYLIKLNSSLGISDDILYFSSRSFIKRIIIVRPNSMIECSKSVNLFQRRKKICDYSIKYYNQRKIDFIKVKNMEGNLYDAIKSKMNKKD